MKQLSHRSTEVHLAPKPAPSSTDRSLWRLLGDLKDDSLKLCKEEAQLAALEVKENASKATLLLILIVSGALAAFAGLIVTLLGFASLLSLAFGADTAIAGPAAGGQLVIGILITVGGGLTAIISIKRLPRQALVPKKTITSIKDDLDKLRREFL